MAQAAAVQSAWKVIPHFRSRDIQVTVDFYSEQLGFTIGGVHGSDAEGKPTFCSVYAGDKAAANIYLSKPSDAEAEKDWNVSSAWIALGTKQLDELYEQLKSNGVVQIAEEIGDKDWGYRQFAIRDPDGNRLTFFKFLEGGNPGGSDES